MSSPDFLEVLRAQANAIPDAMAARFHNITKPRIAQLLEEKAALEIEGAGGADVETRRVAFLASLMNLSLQERNLLTSLAQDVALRAVITAVRAGVALL